MRIHFCASSKRGVLGVGNICLLADTTWCNLCGDGDGDDDDDDDGGIGRMSAYKYSY